MSYSYEHRIKPLFWVRYIGTSNGAYIRADSHNSAKWIFAIGEGLNSIAYLKSTQKHNQQ